MSNFVKTSDGSNTLYSLKYNQHFHDVRTGAITESLQKHILPAFNFHKNKQCLNILDICYGLGYNTLSTIYYLKKNKIDKKINIFSPEFDFELIKSLTNFNYPKEFSSLKNIIKELSQNQKYIDKNLTIELFIGDARAYVKKLENIDIVYQDAFSSEVNYELWTKEYFDDIFKCTSTKPIITTYSIASSVRLSMYEAGFKIYEINPTGKRKQTIALKEKQEFEAKYIDMELKKQRNPKASALYD